MSYQRKARWRERRKEGKESKGGREGRRERGRDEVHRILKMQELHMDRHLDEDFTRESEVSAKTTGTQGKLSQQGFAIGQ